MAALAVILILGLLMWMLLIRPQRRRQLAQDALLANLEAGDEVVTAGGLYGVIEDVDETEVMLEIAPGTTVRVAKRAIAGVVEEEEAEEEDDEDAEEEVEASAEHPPALGTGSDKVTAPEDDEAPRSTAEQRS